VSPYPRSAVFADGRLVRIGGVDVDDLAEQYGTPLWIVDRAELTRRMTALATAMASPADVVYAAKALCVTGVLQIAAQAGLSVDVATGGELATALQAGVPSDRLVVHGNNKSEQELRAALAAGAGRIVVDSFDELDRLERLTRQLDTQADVLLRITPGVMATTHAFVQTGQDDSKFGFTLSSGLAGLAVERVLDVDRLRLRGLHCHIGSQIDQAADFAAAAERLVAMLADLDHRHGVQMDELDLGGGVGIAYTDEDSPLDPVAWARAGRDAVERAVAARGLPRVRVLVEPGRAIVGPAGVTLYRIGTVKQLPGVRTYVAVDGGMSDNVRPALYDVRYTFTPAGRGADRGDGPATVTVVGKHCESGDILGRDVVLPGLPEVGELLAVPATGAYHHSMSSNYNRVPRPAMVLVDDACARLLVRRETVDDLLAADVPLW
jgi:diaminopimelate decarboxylase